MSRILMAASALALGAGAAGAAELDRSGQPIALLFQEGNYAELGFARTIPSLSGRGVGVGPLPAGTDYDDVGQPFTTITGGVKFDINDQLSAAIIVDNPFGADIDYGGNPAATELGQTRAVAGTTSLTGLLRYKFNENFSIHGGIRIQQAAGEIDLGGLAYGPVNGYKVDLKSNTAVGYVIGAAYEIPDIALRVALTYNSEITHKFDTKESGPLIDPDGPGPLPALPLLNASNETEVEVPRSINLDFQTGIAPDTLLFGQIRWVEWSEFRIDPEQFGIVTGGGLVDLEDSTTYTLGIGRRFNETWAGSVTIAYEEEKNKLRSPLAPTNGYFALGLGGSYAVNESTTISAGVRYTWVGDAKPETGTPDVARADFSNNDALSVGVRVGFKF